MSKKSKTTTGNFTGKTLDKIPQATESRSRPKNFFSIVDEAKFAAELSNSGSIRKFFGEVQEYQLEVDALIQNIQSKFPFGIVFPGEGEALAILEIKLPESQAFKKVLKIFNFQDTPYGKKDSFSFVSYPHLRNWNEKAKILFNANQDPFTDETPQPDWNPEDGFVGQTQPFEDPSAGLFEEEE
jgi:hypothetical protein